MVDAGVLALLAFASIDDLVRRKIHLILIVVFAIIGIGLRIYLRDMSLLITVAGAAVGAFLLIVGALSKGQIGSGDGCLIMATGIYLGFWENLALLWLGSFLAAVSSLVFWLVGHKGRKYHIPFAPFLLGAYLVIRSVGG